VDWEPAYAIVLERLDAHVAEARLTLCGLSVCVDATVSLHDAGALLDPSDGEAARFAAMLLERAAAGIGGERKVDWPDGPAWLDARVPFGRDLGGTGAHAARVLTVLGAPALLALDTRSSEQMAVLDPELRLARGGCSIPAKSIAPNRPNAIKTYIFEYTKGRPIGSVVPPRSSRIIVRFDDPGLQHDRDFELLSGRLAPQAGAAILSGFNTVAGGALGSELAWTRELANGWRSAGIPAIHFELAGYSRPEYRDEALRACTGCMTSVGLSLSEFAALLPQTDLASGMRALGQRLGVRRVCVHADEWAAAATLDDPVRERDALLMGSLLASTRAAYGRPLVPQALPPGAVFSEPPELPDRLGEWRFVACSVPYFACPATTLGLGDTFMAGCLLVLGGHAPPAAAHPLTSGSATVADAGDRTHSR
jgi:ADP-specific Phosphofructokinase/Glucokinase conserved region